METTKSTETAWIADEGYSGMDTARFGDMAVVICPPEWSNNGWGFQIFDESDDEAMDYGERCAEGYGFKSEAIVKKFIEKAMRD